MAAKHRHDDEVKQKNKEVSAAHFRCEMKQYIADEAEKDKKELERKLETL